MRTAANSIFSDYLTNAKLKIWFQTGSIYEEVYPLDKTTFADVKYSAVKQYLTQNNPNYLNTYRRSSFSTITFNRNSLSNDDLNSYKLISVLSKRAVDEEKTLRQQSVKDGDEYVLLPKRKQSTKNEQTSNTSPVDLALVEARTQNLPHAVRSFNREYRSIIRTEFRTDLNRILITLIETSQKLLWCHPDAENIFKQAEEFLLRSSSDETSNPTTVSTTTNNHEMRHDQRQKLMDMGFTEQQARRALKRTRYDLHAATELLLTQPDIESNDDDDDDDDEIDQKNQPSAPEGSEPVRTSLFSRDGSFISYRKFRQQRFQPNPRAIQSLKEIGFTHDDIVNALRMFNNDKNLACEYLLSDRQQQQNMNDNDSEQGLDVNSSMFQSIIQNPIVQKTLNNPKTFFIMLQVAENPSSITNYLNDSDIGNMLLQISRIYHAERENMNTSVNNRRDSDHQDENLSRTTGSVSGDEIDDSD